jgi:hypothetical protein
LPRARFERAHCSYGSRGSAVTEGVELAARGDRAGGAPEVLDRRELIEDLGKTAQLIDELWTEVKGR